MFKKWLTWALVTTLVYFVAEDCLMDELNED